MQSSAGKEIEIRAALSSDYGPSPNTRQSFVERLGQNLKKGKQGSTDGRIDPILKKEMPGSTDGRTGPNF